MQLIIINGPCGIGKSTVARKLHEILPLSFLLDIDAERRNISHYHEHRPESLRLAYALALGITDAYLREQQTVIIDKIILDVVFLDSLVALGEKYGATVHELIIWAPKELVMARAETRGFRPSGSLTPEKCEQFWENIDNLKNQRPHATILNIETLDETQVFERVKKIVLSD